MTSSPCVGKCSLNKELKCTGCGRSIQEIEAVFHNVCEAKARKKKNKG